MFDGYHQWLGIPKDQRPPTLYQLLGIAPDAQDPDVVRRAVLERSARVRIHQAGKHAEECRQILDELAVAGLTLRNPAKRKEYDARLARATTPTGPPAQDDGTMRDDRPAVPPMNVPDLRIELPEVPLSHDRQPDSLLFRIAGIIVIIGSVAVLVHNPLAPAPEQRNPSVAFADRTDGGKKPSPVLKASRADPGTARAKGNEPGRGTTVRPTPKTPAEDTPQQISSDRDLEPKETHENQDRLIPPGPDTPSEHLPPHPPAEPPPPKATKDPIADTPKDLLEKNGLKTSKIGLFYIVDAEEKVEAKHREATSQLRSYWDAAERQTAFATRYWSLLRLREESTVAVQAINNLKAFLPTLRRVTNWEKDYFQQVQAELTQLENVENLRQAQMNTLRQMLPPSQEREKELNRLTAEVDDCRKTCQAMTRELRQLVDAARANYEKLAGDDQIMRAVTSLGRRLGPAMDFRKVVDWAKKAEKELRP
jgi:hypothetical protein